MLPLYLVAAIAIAITTAAAAATAIAAAAAAVVQLVHVCVHIHQPWFACTSPHWFAFASPLSHWPPGLCSPAFPLVGLLVPDLGAATPLPMLLGVCACSLSLVFCICPVLVLSSCLWYSTCENIVSIFRVGFVLTFVFGVEDTCKII